MTDHEKHKELREKRHPLPPEDKPCRRCRGTGYLQVNPGSTTVYPCPDCNADGEEMDTDDN